jgi:predicted RNase H-like HicB family nuclease
MNQRLTAIIQSKEGGYVALCPELDIASQGNTIETARQPS